MSNIDPSFIDYEDLAKSNILFMDEMVNVVEKVLRRGWYILGDEVKGFEEEFAAYMGVRHCLGVANGLDALILSIKALDLPKKSEILVASNTYIATILAILHAGHTPVLVEPNIKTFNIDPDLLQFHLSQNTRAICVTHMFGKPCEMDRILRFSKNYGLFLIEDCAQSHGAKFRNQLTGTFGDIGCFSFYPTKNLGAAGDAGAIICNNDKFYEKIKSIRNYGSNEKYYNSYIGSNSRLDELQAAILRIKLRYLDKINDHKRTLASYYLKLLPDWIIVPDQNPHSYDVYHIFAIRHDRRELLREHLLKNFIKTEIHYPVPPHRQKCMKDIIFGDYPIADKLHDTELSLPISYSHQVMDIMRIIKVINKFIHI